MEKINIAELLKDCPKGMELNCVMFEQPVKYMGLAESGTYIIIIKTSCGMDFYLTKEGYPYDMPDSKCIIFPKGKTTWEGFVSPCKFKDGDMIYNQGIKATAIFYKQTDDSTISHCFLNKRKELKIRHNHCKLLYDWRLATEEEKAKLFDAINANGYKWNAETKTLEKLVEPKFKVGDNIRIKGTSAIYVVTEIREDCYMLDDKDIALPFSTQDYWELVPSKFDITTLIPFESRVLARYCEDSKWIPTFWGAYDKEDPEYPYNCCGMLFAQCIPYEGNEHLLSKNDDCDDFYKTWE